MPKPRMQDTRFWQKSKVEKEERDFDMIHKSVMDELYLTMDIAIERGQQHTLLICITN